MKLNSVLFSSLLLVLPARAQHSKNSCHYYEEVKSQWHCGPQGYIETFAQSYCETYLRNRNDFSPQAQIVLKNIRYCLQTYLKENFKGTTCEELRAAGMASHEYCYFKHGYCELDTKDLIKIM